MADGNLGEMSFWDHVDALRGVLLRAGAVVLLMAIVFFAAMPEIFDRIILAPTRPDFCLYGLLASLGSVRGITPDFNADFSVSLINIQLASQFFIHKFLARSGVLVPDNHLSSLELCCSRPV